MSGNPPKANFTCIRAQESSTGIVYGFAAWSVPCDVHLLETIQTFVVWKQFISSNGPKLNSHLTYIKPLVRYTLLYCCDNIISAKSKLLHAFFFLHSKNRSI